MRALQSFSVRLRLPDALAPLRDLAMNLRWSWDTEARRLFRTIDPDVWAASRRDPLRLLASLGPGRLEALAADADFLATVARRHETLTQYLEGDRWFQAQDSAVRSIAYFSPEFGIVETLPQYSGGLGVLAGDHLKAASDLGVPMIGVGLCYRQGYFRQRLGSDGWQREVYTALDPGLMALEPCDGADVNVELPGEVLRARVWRARVGRVPLYLLESESPDGASGVTDRLYGGDTEHRLRQEILLGIGGVRALDALGAPAQVFHTNEGHAGFLGLERIRRLVVDHGLTFGEAVEAARAGTAFTTHTPVPAGIDRFPRPLMERYFASLAEECGVPFDDVMALGHEPGEPRDAPFNMAVMGLRLAGFANGVSKLHGEVSRRIFAGVWPGLPEDEVPIGSITNGVHSPTWLGAEVRAVLDANGLAATDATGVDLWEGIVDVDDAELWQARCLARERLVGFVRRRGIEGRDDSGAAVEWRHGLLDPDVLTIGFARRFATYKRATLLLSQEERIARLLLAADRPVQLVFAGKAHPADDAGKDMIRTVVQFARRPDLRHRVVFVEDYDMAVGRAMSRGCDLWLNNPRRPLEASGTSGEKAALNGGLNFSIVDGWWNECFDGYNGWAIPSAEDYEDLAERDRAEADALFEVLEREIVPLFYDRDENGVPRKWLARVKASMSSLGPFVNASRMVREYVGSIYEPAARRADLMTAERHSRARRLAAWKARVTPAWADMRIAAVRSDSSAAEVGDERAVSVDVALGDLRPDDVEVQVVHGRMTLTGELAADAVTTLLAAAAPDGSGCCRYEGAFRLQKAGPYGFNVRVVPSHPDLRTAGELGLVTWG